MWHNDLRHLLKNIGQIKNAEKQRPLPNRKPQTSPDACMVIKETNSCEKSRKENLCSRWAEDNDMRELWSCMHAFYPMLNSCPVFLECLLWIVSIKDAGDNLAHNFFWETPQTYIFWPASHKNYLKKTTWGALTENRIHSGKKWNLLLHWPGAIDHRRVQS
jgi:hypothetical protein